jgi:hypothetical protein
MNKTIKKSILLILIATMLIASSASLMQVQACAITKPTPTGEFYIYPPNSNVYSYSSSSAPSLGEEDGDPIYYLPSIITPYWYVSYITYQYAFSGREEVFVHYDPTGMTPCQQKHLRLYIYDPVDFNLDGIVNRQDIALMQQAIKSGTNPDEFDINHDGFVNNADLRIVMQFASDGLIANPGHCGVPQGRLPWLDITAGVDTTNHYVYGFTDHFSCFGVR